MMEKLEDFLRFLTREIAWCGNIISHEWVRQWPKGRLQELIEMGVLIETQPGTYITCHECDEDCSLEPNIVTYPDGKTVGLFFCARESHTVEIPMEHFKRWEVIPAKLAELGYGTPIKDEELTNEEAAKLIGGIGRGTISKLAQFGYLKSNGCTGKQHRVMKSSVLLFKEKRDKEKEIQEALDKLRVEKAKK
jgi:hypothetical protein